MIRDTKPKFNQVEDVEVGDAVFICIDGAASLHWTPGFQTAALVGGQRK